MAGIPPRRADTVYQIISGYYPEITSGPRADKTDKSSLRGGYGSTGAKYKLVKGWTESSMEAMEQAPAIKEMNVIKQPENNAGLKVKKAYRKAKVGEKGYKEGDYPDLQKGDFTGEYIQYWKWSGGSDKFRLFGDMVWHMYANREGKEQLISNYVKGLSKTAPAFNSIYKNTSPALAKTARSMADKAVENALKEVAQEVVVDNIKLWREEKAGMVIDGDLKAMAPEELGFTIGGAEYMSTPAAQKAGYKIGDIAKGSMANVVDMVKVVDGKVVEVMDVTEESITKSGQHGLSDALEGMAGVKKAIKEFALDTTDNTSEPIVAIKEAVSKMFVSAVNDEYNPIIRKLTKFAETQGEKSKKGDENLLKAVQKKLEKEGKVGTPDIATAAGIQMGKATTLSGGKRVVNETSLKYITHMIGTVGGNIGSDFTQSHRVADYPDGSRLAGQSLYATVPMKMDPETLLFDPQAPEGTVVNAGFNATLALAVAKGEMKPHEAAEFGRAQNQAWQYQRINGATNTSRGAKFNAATMGLQQHAHHSTTVSAIAGPALEKILESIVRPPKGKAAAMSRAINKEVNKHSYYWDDSSSGKYGNKKYNNKRMTKGYSNRVAFWALPYIGIQQSEYTGAEK